MGSPSVCRRGGERDRNPFVGCSPHVVKIKGPKASKTDPTRNTAHLLSYFTLYGQLFMQLLRGHAAHAARAARPTARKNNYKRVQSSSFYRGVCVLCGLVLDYFTISEFNENRDEPQRVIDVGGGHGTLYSHLSASGAVGGARRRGPSTRHSCR